MPLSRAVIAGMAYKRTSELEKKLEDRCVDRIKALGGEALKLVLLGLMGWPDRTCLLPGGRLFFLELKRQRTGRVRTQQKWWADRLGDLGFRVYVVDDDEKFERILARELAA